MTRSEAIKAISRIGTAFVVDDSKVRSELKEQRREFIHAIRSLKDSEPKTRKPCPGCNETSQHATRAVDSVCSECALKLKTYNDLVSARERPKENLYLLPTRDYGWPYIYINVRRHMSEVELSNKFRNLIWKVCSLLGRPAAADRTWAGRDKAKQLPAAVFKSFKNQARGEWYDGENVRLMTPEEAETIDQLDLVCRQLFKETYASGVEVGQDLLGQIARGEMTIADFNEESLRLKG